MKRFLIAFLLVFSLAVAACTEEQKTKAVAVVTGASVVTQAMASMPIPPGMENTAWAQQFTYWSNYASGVTKGLSEVVKDTKNPTASASPAAQ